MPLIDVQCTVCELVSEVFRHHSEHPKTPACPKCDGATLQVHLPQYMKLRALPPAVVVFAAPDGSFRFPGDPNGSQAARYEQMGYARKEFRGWAEVRSLESRVNKQQYSEIVRRVERHQALRERGQHERRSEMTNGIRNGFSIPETEERTIDGRRVMVRTGRMKTVKLTPIGHDVAEAAIARNNGRPASRAYDPGFHVSAYSYDKSNREQHRDERGSKSRD
jgi:hypothetical protein